LGVIAIPYNRLLLVKAKCNDFSEVSITCYKLVNNKYCISFGEEIGMVHYIIYGLVAMAALSIGLFLRMYSLVQ